MLQYLLNATAIWLISLLSYDIFLRRESYHSYNRFYLLATFVLGALLPMLQWHDYGAIPATSGLDPVARVIAAKQTIMDAGSPAAEIDWSVWLTVTYCLGAVVALTICCIDIIKLGRYSRAGNKVIQGNWAIIETGKEHTPFSFRNTLFVCSRAQYSGEEWQMILSHESRHSTLFHIADVVLLQLAKIIFWFHPLVYMYNKRLLLVHEYQADSVAAPQPQVYGRFLVEQAMLRSAPSLSHSFNRSPIKNRIVMLTRNSSALAKSKMLVFVPVALVCLLCFSKDSFSQKFEKKGNVVTYRGNKFEYAIPYGPDTVTMTDPVTGKEVQKIVSFDAVPMKMNGEKIYRSDSVTVLPAWKDGAFEEYILNQLTNELNQLPDGEYSINMNNVVIDKKGKAVFYEYRGFYDVRGFTDENKIVPEKLRNTVSKKIDELVRKAPVKKPASLHGKSVTVLADAYLARYKITVQNHKATIHK